MPEPVRKVMSDVRPRSMDMARRAPVATQTPANTMPKPGDTAHSSVTKPVPPEATQAEQAEQPAKKAKPKKPFGKRVLRWVITVLVLLVVVAIAAATWIIYVNFYR